MKKPKPIMPASRRAVKDLTSSAPKAYRSIPTGSKPGKAGTGKSPLTAGLGVMPDRTPKRRK